MDSAGWFLLFLLIGVVALLVFLNKKSESDSPSYTPPTPTPAPKPPEPTPPNEKEQKYISIYEYTPVQTVKRCAYCDGENKHGTKVCCICGNDIDS